MLEHEMSLVPLPNRRGGRGPDGTPNNDDTPNRKLNRDFIINANVALVREAIDMRFFLGMDERGRDRGEISGFNILGLILNFMEIPQHNILRNVWVQWLLQDNIEAYGTNIDEFIRRGGRDVSISCPGGSIERCATLVAIFRMMRDRPIINEEARRQREAFRRREEEMRRAIARAGDEERARLEAEAQAAREEEERRRREAELEAERLRDEEKARKDAETAKQSLASQKRGPKRSGRHGGSDLLKSRYDKVQDWFGEYSTSDGADEYGDFKPHKVKEFFDRKIAENRSPDVGDHQFHNTNEEWDGSIRRYIDDLGEDMLGFENGTKWGQTEAEYNAAKAANNNAGNNNNNNIQEIIIITIQEIIIIIIIQVNQTREIIITIQEQTK